MIDIDTSKTIGSTFRATECNQLTTEDEAIVASGGLTPSDSDLEQMAKAIANYSCGAQFFKDASVAQNNIYLLNRGTLTYKSITQYADGMEIRFRPNFSNTTSASVNINSLGSVPIVEMGTFAALTSNEIIAGILTKIIYNSAQGKFELLRNADIVNSDKVGDIKLSLNISQELFWLLMGDDTWDVGNVSSGAHYSSVDLFPLFEFLWDTFDNTSCPVPSGRGASAIDDWSSDKTIQFGQVCSRTLVTAGTGTGLTPRALKSTFGNETHTLDPNELANHGHGVNDPGHTHALNPSPAYIWHPGSQGGTAGGDISADPGSISSSATSISIQNSGGGGPHNNIQPSLAAYAFIRK